MKGCCWNTKDASGGEEFNPGPETRLDCSEFLCNRVFSSVQSLTSVWLFATPWIAACQVSLSITSSWSPPNHMPIVLVMPSNSSSVIPFSSCPQSFPASGYFQVSQLFASGGQSIGVSASTSVLSVNTNDWCPLGWTGVGSPCSSRDSPIRSPMLIS